MNVNIPANSTEKEVKVYSGRHYNTDRSVYKKFAEDTGIKVRLIEAAGISFCLLYTSPSPRDATLSRMPSSA